MSDYIIYKDQDLLDANVPTTHAIIIGVGKYSYVNGGDGGHVTDLDGGMGQLSSPPESAKTFMTWLLDKYNNPGKPLATVSLLISEKDGPLEFDHPNLPNPVTPEEATIANVKEAVREWKDFGDRNEENLILFFFCGHGVASGLEGLTLLLTDYGKSNHQPMEGAVDFAAMLRGMAQCKASEQLYFVDACRKTNDIATRTQNRGDSIIQDAQNRPWTSDWQCAVFYSTLGGEAAYGRKNKPSFYTEELINGLNGTGSNNHRGDEIWRVSTSDLLKAINRGLSLRGDRLSPPMTTQTFFEFHELLDPPTALAVVNCNPKSDNEFATLFCRQENAEIAKRPPAKEDWGVFVPYGHYDFIADKGGTKGEKTNQRIFPPYKEIVIEVAQ